MGGGGRGEDTLGEGGQPRCSERRKKASTPMRGWAAGAGCQSPRTKLAASSCLGVAKGCEVSGCSDAGAKTGSAFGKSGRDAEKQEEERGPGCGKPRQGSPLTGRFFCSSSRTVNVRSKQE